MVFAEVAAIRRVGLIARIIRFSGVEELQSRAEALRERDGLILLALRQAGRHGEQRDNVFRAQRIQRGLQHERAVHAAGVGDRDAAERLKVVSKSGNHGMRSF